MSGCASGRRLLLRGSRPWFVPRVEVPPLGAAACGRGRRRLSTESYTERPADDLAFPDLGQTVATPAVCEQLRTDGWAVVDGGFGETWCHLLRDDIITLAESRALGLNATHTVRGGKTELLPKQGILETELESPALQAACPWIARVLNDSTLKTALEAGLGAATVGPRPHAAQPKDCLWMPVGRLSNRACTHRVEARQADRQGPAQRRPRWLLPAALRLGSLRRLSGAAAARRPAHLRTPNLKSGWWRRWRRRRWR